MDTVKTVVRPALFGYIKKKRLEHLLEELFGRRIEVYLGNDRYWFYAPREVTVDELKYVYPKMDHHPIFNSKIAKYAKMSQVEEM